MGAVKSALTTCPDCDGERGHIHQHGPGRPSPITGGYEPDETWEACPRCDETGTILDPSQNPSYGAYLAEQAEDAALEQSALIHQAREEEHARTATADRPSRHTEATRSESTRGAAETVRRVKGDQHATAHR